MFDTIVAPIDGSECAERAFRLAMTLAKAQNAQLRVCSVIDPLDYLGSTPPSPLAGQQLEAARGEAERGIADAVSRAKANGIRAEGRLLLGAPPFEIVNYAAVPGAQAIVMGTHGRSGLKRLMTGSVAESVLRSAQCPVILLREGVAVPQAEAAAS
jgi:nucleotide-binding universal stress UspA family protein